MQLAQPKQAFHHSKVISLFARIGFVFLFTPLFFVNLGTRNAPITVEFLDACHCIFFFFAALLTFSHIKLPVKQRVLLTLSAIFFISLVVESAQELVGRSFQWADIYRNVLGFGLGASVVIFKKSDNALRKTKAALCFCFLLSLALFERAPLITQAANQLYMRTHSPVLANFEHEFELLNWSAKHANLSHSGNAMFIDTNSSQKMAKVSFKHFPQDWSEFDHVVVEMENVGKEPIKIKLVVTNTKQDDKAVKEISLHPGLSIVKLSYAHLLVASDINRLTLYAQSPTKNRAQIKLHSVSLNQEILDTQLIADVGL